MYTVLYTVLYTRVHSPHGHSQRLSKQDFGVGTEYGMLVCLARPGLSLQRLSKGGVGGGGAREVMGFREISA